MIQKSRSNRLKMVYQQRSGGQEPWSIAAFHGARDLRLGHGYTRAEFLFTAQHYSALQIRSRGVLFTISYSPQKLAIQCLH